MCEATFEHNLVSNFERKKEKKHWFTLCAYVSSIFCVQFFSRFHLVVMFSVFFLFFPFFFLSLISASQANINKMIAANTSVRVYDLMIRFHTLRLFSTKWNSNNSSSVPSINTKCYTRLKPERKSACNKSSNISTHASTTRDKNDGWSFVFHFNITMYIYVYTYVNVCAGFLSRLSHTHTGFWGQKLNLQCFPKECSGKKNSKTYRR